MTVFRFCSLHCGTGFQPVSQFFSNGPSDVERPPLPDGRGSDRLVATLLSSRAQQLVANALVFKDGRRTIQWFAPAASAAPGLSRDSDGFDPCRPSPPELERRRPALFVSTVSAWRLGRAAGVAPVRRQDRCCDHVPPCRCDRRNPMNRSLAPLLCQILNLVVDNPRPRVCPPKRAGGSSRIRTSSRVPRGPGASSRRRSDHRGSVAPGDRPRGGAGR